MVNLTSLSFLGATSACFPALHWEPHPHPLLLSSPEVGLVSAEGSRGMRPEVGAGQVPAGPRVTSESQPPPPHSRGLGFEDCHHLSWPGALE